MSDDTALALIQDLRKEAEHNAYEKYSGPAQIAGVSLSILSYGALSVLVPIGLMGPVVGVSAGVLVYALAISHTNSEMKRCNTGGLDVIKQYVPKETIAQIAQKHITAKKPLAQGAKNHQKSQSSGHQTATKTTSQSPEQSISLPVAPVALDSAAPHLYLWGRTQNGKTETLKHLLQSEKHVHYVTSKGTDTVPVDWHGWQVSGKTLGAQMTWLLDKWETAYQMHQQGGTAREWFVIDEAVGIVKALTTKGHKDVAERLVAFIVEVLTAGASQGAYLALLSQTSNSGPIQVDLDILKNCRVVACSKGRRDQMVAAFTKLTDYKLKPEQKEEIDKLSGYWQLWDGPQGPTLSQIEPLDIDIRPVQACPQSDLQATEKEDLRLLERIACEVKKQCATADDGHITVRAAAQCLPGDKRKEYYPRMLEFCTALATEYPEDFKMLKGLAQEDRIAHLKSPNWKDG